MRRYIWQNPEWPKLQVEYRSLASLLDESRKGQFGFLGALFMTPQERQLESVIAGLTDSTVHSSEIEGEHLNPDAVRSSVARRLGAKHAAIRVDDRTEGAVDMTLDATRGYESKLTRERLCNWQAGLFPARRGEVALPWAGRYRTAANDPMQIVSEPIGRERVHYEAPPANRVSPMMADFLDWFGRSRDKENGLVRAALAHLWFETIHPFVDGNGRVGRAVADMALAQDERTPDRFYSLSAQIAKDTNTYYDALQSAQHGSLDVTAWVRWFVETLVKAIGEAQRTVDRARQAVQFWETHRSFPFNARQRQVLRRILNDFEGDLNLRKYIAISEAPRATAQRDLAKLVENGILEPAGQGKATHYLLKDNG